MSSHTHSLFYRLTPLIGLFLFSLAAIMIWHSIDAYHWSEIQQALLSIPHPIILASIMTALIGYLLLSLYDWLAMTYANETLPYPKVLLASFLGYAVSNNVGHPLVSGGTIRYRLYSKWGLSAASIARIILFCSSSYVVGAVTLLVATYLLSPSLDLVRHHFPQHVFSFIMGISAILLLAWWGLIIAYHDVPLTIKGFQLFLPRPSLAVRQLLVALLDIFIASFVLYLPLHAAIPIDFSTFLMLYVMAQLMGLISQVPGGIGVFEGSFLFLTHDIYNPASVLAALITCRVAYYFIPLALAGCIFVIYETIHMIHPSNKNH